jgi:hypothetical protein
MNDQIQNKLLQYEAQPPDRTWDEIAAALDSGAGTFADKLYRFEQTPRDTAWQKIHAQLDARPAAIPFHKRYSRPLKYSATIAAMVVIAVLLSLLISKKTVSEGVATTIKQTPASRNGNNISTAPQNTEEQKQISIARLNTNKHVGHIKLSAAKASFWLGPEPTLRPVAMLNNIVPEVAERSTAIDYSTPVDKYMMYSDGDGNPIRLPKKLYDAFACATDRINCKQKIKRLQEQAAAAAMSTDFTGILDVLNKLEENQ